MVKAEVACVTNELLSSPFLVPGPVAFTAFPSLLMKSISWSPPDMPNGVIIAYEVSYRPTDSSQSVTRLNTTDLATSFTTQSDLEVGTEFIFSVRAYTRVGPGNESSVTVSTLREIMYDSRTCFYAENYFTPYQLKFAYLSTDLKCLTWKLQQNALHLKQTTLQLLLEL